MPFEILNMPSYISNIEIQLNLKQMYDILGMRGYLLHRNLVHLSQMKCTKYPELLPVSMCESCLCSCVENNDELDSDHSVVQLITSFSSSPQDFIQRSNEYRLKPEIHQQRSLNQEIKSDTLELDRKLEIDGLPRNADKNDASMADISDSIQELAIDNGEKGSANDNSVYANALQSDDEMYEWEYLNRDIRNLSPLDMIDLLVQAACDDIDQNPNDTVLYLCLHEVYAERYKISGSKYDMENAKKSLETSLEITYHANSIGMTGWLGYGKSTVLDRALERPYFTLSNLASFHASSEDWTSSVSILKSLMLRCEHHLPLYHPITIVTILDVAAGLTVLNKEKIAQNYIIQARSRLVMYLQEQEDACRRLHTMHLSRKEEPYQYFKLVGLDHYSMLRSFTQSMRVSLRRKLLKRIPNENFPKILNHCFVSDSLMVLGHCLKNVKSDSGNDKEIDMLFSLAGEEYRRALNALIPSKGSSDPNSIAVSCGLAYCLSELKRPNEGLHLLSTIISSSLHTLQTGKKQNHPQNIFELEEDYDGNFKIITSKLGLSLRESIASALRLMAHLHLEERPNEEGRVAAIGQMRIALELITKSESSVETKHCKSMRRTIKKELKTLLEDTRYSAADNISLTRPNGTSPTASAAV
jgi:hypothetical protein